MNTKLDETRPCWFVGSVWDGDDQTERFLKEGTWENGHPDKYLDDVKSIQVGDRIAIKSAYTKKRNLPFDNQGKDVSTMAIKATGTVTNNPSDGQTLSVQWKPIAPHREWYYFTGLTTLWRVSPGDWKADALIAFTFNESDQDIDRFKAAYSQDEGVSDDTVEATNFEWTPFYEAIANKLLSFQHRRDVLIAAIHEMSTRVDGMSNLTDRFTDDVSGPLTDTCPFTVMSMFNRQVKDINRVNIATELANFLGVFEPVPTSFEGIPRANNQNSWFFGFSKDRRPNDIDILWDVFARAIAFADSGNEETRSEFARSYDSTVEIYRVNWNLTMGLHWIRPWVFPTLDSHSRRYITTKLNLEIRMRGPSKCCNSDAYLNILDKLGERFQADEYPIRSFPELSLTAQQYQPSDTPPLPKTEDPGGADDESVVAPYLVDNIVEEGCFIEEAKIEQILKRFKEKKNLILQGPPGTGKSWLAKRLAYALIEQRDKNRVRAFQFHPNLSYEDFVRGWRPTKKGRLTLQDGPFLEMINAAKQEPTSKHVMVIEEINRGNPAQIFGELLTLIEADKRKQSEALELTYNQSSDELVYVPSNLYIVGTMNVADRSLALVDLALRRRFAFIDLKPLFNEFWYRWVQDNAKIDSDVLNDIQSRIEHLNQEISSDKNLGKQYEIGHSYFTPPKDSQISDARNWFRDIVKTEVGPLLDEYWFDDPNKSESVKDRLLRDF